MNFVYRVLFWSLSVPMTAALVSCGQSASDFVVMNKDSGTADTDTGDDTHRDTPTSQGGDTDTDSDADMDSDSDADSDGDSDADTDSDTDTHTDIDRDIVDPMGDSSSFAFVFKYQGEVWLGPRTDGNGAVHLEPGSSTVEETAFSFGRDSIGDNSHRSDATAPYPSIGAAGCKKDTIQCGPDNENGRGIFSSGNISGNEWLVVAGGRSEGDLDYIYMTKDSGAHLDFAYVDLADVLGPQTRGTSAMHVFGDRLYIGAPDTGAKRPYLVMLQNLPTGDGLDAIGNGIKGGACNPSIHDACVIRADQLPGIGKSAEVAIIDSMTDFADRLYVANNGGIVRSRVAEPLDAVSHPEHWTEVTPSSSDFSNFSSVTTSKTAEIEPADKAVPRMVSWGGKLFFARNTVSGPQLWSCRPGKVKAPLPATETDCDAGDWQLIASNTIANLSLSQFNNGNNTHISLLETTDDFLYVGFDNQKDGIVLLRTSRNSPSAMSDFMGESDCTADQHPATCEGIGGNGLGSASTSRIFSATFSAVGKKEYLYLVVGSGTDTARLSLLVR